MTPPSDHNSRRDFFKRTASVGTLSVLGALGVEMQAQPLLSADRDAPDIPPLDLANTTDRGTTVLEFPRQYADATLSRVAFPMGGIGAGMLCLEGSGALSHVSLRHHPDVFNEPAVYAALTVRGAQPVARVLEGPVPDWKIFGRPNAARGDEDTTYGLPRFRRAAFTSRFPFGTVTLTDDQLPVTVHLTGWSPFIPGDADNSSLPVAALEYRIVNTSAAPVSAVFSFNARNFMKGPISATPGGFVLGTPAASFAAAVEDPTVQVNHAWFRGDWYDPFTLAWKDVASGTIVSRPPLVHPTSADPKNYPPEPQGASLFVPLELAPHAEHTVVLRLSWYVGESTLRYGRDVAGAPPDTTTYKPWYAGHYADLAAVSDYWRTHYAELKQRTARFTDTFYDSTLPPEVLDAVAANLSILKSPTVLRQTDGRLWVWEGCNDTEGSCAGSCTHVWNYAQAIAHLFPALERTLRDTEFNESLNEAGHQTYRTALPIRPAKHWLLAAADGQLGGMMKVYRDWRISGDTAWLRRLWPHIRRSLDYCIRSWDPHHRGWLDAPHHNTYDIEFCGPDGMCTSIYLGALHAAVVMGTALHDDVVLYKSLYDTGRKATETQLYNGEYFYQRVDRTVQSPPDTIPVDAMVQVRPTDTLFPEERVLVEHEGPKYQYGTGCLSDGVIGAWMALACGVGHIIDPHKVSSHLAAVHRYNFKSDLTGHTNTQRPSFAVGHEGGLLLCSWPQGGKPALPFVYSDEVWTGVEYQVASHLMMVGKVQEGLEIVRTCRARYDGRIRNPYNEYECGHWYGRALASYALLQGLSGAWYDAVDQVLYLTPSIPGDFRAFLATATGYGTVGVREGKPFLETASGMIEVREIKYHPHLG